MTRYLLLLTPALFFLSGCDHEDRLAKLEKQNQELQAEIKKKSSAPADLESQAKCSRDSKAWFDQNWGRGDKDTTLLNYTNHFSKSLNQCFILVEYHYKLGDANSWFNNISLWNVYDNSQYGRFGESHYVWMKPEMKTEDRVGSCEILGNKCKTFDEFSNLSAPYMRD